MTAAEKAPVWELPALQLEPEPLKPILSLTSPATDSQGNLIIDTELERVFTSPGSPQAIRLTQAG